MAVAVAQVGLSLSAVLNGLFQLDLNTSSTQLTWASFISPVLSGLLAKAHHSGGADASWRWAFLPLAGLSAVSVVVTLVGATSSSGTLGRALHAPGQLTVGIGLFALLFAVIRGADDCWTSATVLGRFVAAVVFLVAFVLIERRVATPLIRLELVTNRVFVGSAIVTGTSQPLNPLKDVAFRALPSAYSLGYLVCGLTAVAAALIAGLLLVGQTGSSMEVA